jgi:hypothetical protein
LKELAFTTSSDIDISDQNISDFILYRNYPNPFNPSTRISFNLKNESQIELKIFNSKGELVQNLAAGKMSKGLHNFSFKADEINSGVYFYRLSIDGVAKETRKMLYLK